MTKSPSIVIKTLLTLAVAGSMAAFFVQPAAAQTAGKLKCTGCVKSKQLKNGGIKGKDIKDGAVGSSAVASESIPATDQSNEAGMDFAGGNQSIDLTGTDTIVRFVSITAPTSGFVAVNASAYISALLATGGGARCSITTGTVVDFDNVSLSEVEGADNFEAIGMTRGFAVNAGTTTFNLVCEEFVGNIFIIDSQMTAMYFPTQY